MGLADPRQAQQRHHGEFFLQHDVGNFCVAPPHVELLLVPNFRNVLQLETARFRSENLPFQLCIIQSSCEGLDILGNIALNLKPSKAATET